ncbi:hypothetical protein [Halobacterium jilantaiense]|uniref:Uncharacterized protein n=1 Tax=Halobacterium jilantaiense TaxID=355548 RepID=A0A1I0Q0X3_9EURY|nr:hypothetical protein [Halobacterium jilantaiense]SEW20412.1 hypothetical protein SAMN04487945_2154 [Halobacterium jilantaiense]
MGERANGPILTSTRRDVLQGDYDRPSRQAEQDHKDAIEENTQLGLQDYQFLFNHVDQEDLADIIGGEADSEDGPVAHDSRDMDLADLEWDNAREFFTKQRDQDGRIWPPDQNPDAKIPYERYREELKQSNKATPEMQKTLIDCIGFLCRAAEAGELDIHDLIERGVERYYRTHPTEENRLVDVRSWSEEKNAEKIKAYSRQTDWEPSSPEGEEGESATIIEGSSSFDPKEAESAIARFLARDGRN